MKDFTCGLDVRKIPLSEFPDPPDHYYKWSMEANELVLSVPDEEYFYVRYDVPGGYICSHAEKEIVAFFVDSIREVCQRVSGQAASVSEAEKEERVLSADDVAKYFLTLSEPNEGDFLSLLKLQKLVYYAQGFHLVLFGKPLFKEKILRWSNGPAVEELWQKYPSACYIDIPPKGIILTIPDKDEKDLLDDVWDTYGQFSAWKLHNMVLQEPPWKNTPPVEEISHAVMVDYFKDLVDEKQHCPKHSGQVLEEDIAEYFLTLSERRKDGCISPIKQQKLKSWLGILGRLLNCKP